MEAVSRVEELLKKLRAALADADIESAARSTDDLRPQQILECWDELSGRERRLLLRALPPEKAAELTSNLAEDQLAELPGLLPMTEIRDLLVELDPDDLADALQAIQVRDPQQVDAVKALLGPELRATAESLTAYEEDAAGGLMTPEFISLRASMTVDQVLTYLRRAGPAAETIYYLYVVDAEGHLTGVLSLRELIVSPASTRISRIMGADVVRITTDTDQEEVARLMSDYDLAVLPVVDEEDRLVGIVTVDDVLDVVEDEATEDIHRLGAAPIDIDYARAQPWLLFRKRAAWLLLLVVSMALTVPVLDHYNDVLAEIAILVSFIPLIIGTGGNVGSQVSTLVVRALGTRELEARDYLRVLWKEFRTGLLIGGSFGVFIGIAVYLFRPSEPRVAIALGLTMIFVALTANLIGASLPFLFRRLGFDPALTSSPAMTTVMDVVGLLIYFRVVLWVAGPLLGG